MLPVALALHIPDGFLNVQIALASWVPTMVLLAIAITRTRVELAERQVPLMGIMAAFIFAAQMINFPVAGGTSGHLLGGVLAAIALGPWAAMLVMASVVGLQALLFQDGGLVTMGANILNMGLITALIGGGLYRAVRGHPLPIRLTVAGLAAWLSVVAGALAVTLQLWLSGTAALEIVARAMLAVHAVIGLGEALITVAAVAFITRTRADLLEGANSGRGWIVGGFAASAVVVLLAPFASADPDGLERVAEDVGFLDLAREAPYSFLPDYAIPFLGNSPLSTGVAGALGAVLVALIALAIGRALVRRAQADRRAA